jgi:two-component system sensor histidine kinase BaeS
MHHGASSRDAPDAWARLLLSDEYDLAAMAVQDGIVVNANSTAATLFGRRVVGAGIHELFDHGSWGKLDAALAGSGSIELQIAGEGDAEPRAARFLVLPHVTARLLVSPSSGRLSYSEEQGRELMRLNDELGLLTRELSRHAQELTQARGRLERLDALRQQFMAMLAHDLKASLSAVRLIARGLARSPEGQSGDKIRVAGQRLDRSVLRMTSLVDTVLVAARLEDSELALSAKPTSLDALARDAIDAVEPLATERRLVMACDAEGDTTAPVDVTWIGQVLANLLVNAIRHAPKESTVRVSLLGDAARVLCAVADEGEGVPPELREAVFERFRQTGSRPGSAGLGLYVARRLVALHGGRIWIEDAKGAGARFCFEIPKSVTTSR